MACAAIAMWLGFGWPFDEEGKWPTTPFDSAAWKALPEQQRYVMVRDLISRNIWDGLDRNEVVALLGPPDHEASNRITYFVKRGAVSMSLNETFYLDLYFEDQDGEITRHMVRGN